MFCLFSFVLFAFLTYCFLLRVSCLFLLLLSFVVFSVGFRNFCFLCLVIIVVGASAIIRSGAFAIK